MHDKKYNSYSVEDLLHDQEFVSIVLEYSSEKKWGQFLESHQDSRSNMRKARKLIQLFKINMEQVEEERKFKLWKDITGFDKEYTRKNKIRRLKGIIRIAASVLIILSISSVAYLGLYQQKSFYGFAESNSTLTTDHPVLLLANGEQIVLEKEDPEIKFLENKDAIIINNEKMINISAQNDNSEGQKLNEIVVPYGRKSSLVLRDGTKVWLNAGSRFAFPQKFDGKKRTVFIEGEGYFEVAKNVKKAFHVFSESIEVEVLGTKFNLSAYKSDDFSEAVLLEGSVNVWGKGKLIRNRELMKPNQKTVFSKVEKDLKTSIVKNPQMYISWVEGWYRFSKEDLIQVLKKIERHYNVTFSYDKNAMAKALPISGKLDLNRSVDEVMPVLSSVAKMNYKMVDDNLIIIN